MIQQKIGNAEDLPKLILYGEFAELQQLGHDNNRLISFCYSKLQSRAIHCFSRS